MTGVLPCLIPPVEAEPGMPAGPLGDPLLDAYLEFVAARSRPNTVLVCDPRARRKSRGCRRGPGVEVIDVRRGTSTPFPARVRSEPRSPQPACSAPTYV